MIVVVFGLPGTGKSYFACRLAEKLNAEYVSSDQIRFSMIKNRKYNKEEKMHVYRKMLVLTESLVNKKKHVILDGTFYKEEIRQMFLSLALSLKVKIFFIEVTAEDWLVKKRVEKKRAGSEADYDVYLKIKKLFEPMDSKHLMLESTQTNIENMLQKAIQSLG